MLGARGAFGSSLSEPRSYNEAEVEFSFNHTTIILQTLAIGSQGFLEAENIRIDWLVDFGEGIDFQIYCLSFTIPQISLQIFLHTEVTFE